jgi:large conductance mechanosensitive channel
VVSQFFKDFRTFALKGNIIDMAIGVIIGGAFNKIVSALVNDILMPTLGSVIGKVNFSQLYILLGEGSYATLADAVAAGAPVLKYGAFIQSLVDFTIIALTLFVFVRVLQSMQKKQEALAPAAPPEETVLLREIRDALTQK